MMTIGRFVLLGAVVVLTACASSGLPRELQEVKNERRSIGICVLENREYQVDDAVVNHAIREAWYSYRDSVGIDFYITGHYFVPDSIVERLRFDGGEEHRIVYDLALLMRHEKTLCPVFSEITLVVSNRGSYDKRWGRAHIGFGIFKIFKADSLGSLHYMGGTSRLVSTIEHEVGHLFQLQFDPPFVKQDTMSMRGQMVIYSQSDTWHSPDSTSFMYPYLTENAQRWTSDVITKLLENKNIDFRYLRADSLGS